MKTISYTNAQRIIDIACGLWKDRLADAWSKQIVKKENCIAVGEELLKEMRSAANSEQKGILDQIFGREEPNENIKAGEWIIITDFGRANPSNSFKLDSLYKLSRDFNKENGLCVEMDYKGNVDNGWESAFEMGIKIRRVKQI